MYNVFSAFAEVAVGANLTLMNIIASATVRPYLCEFDLGCPATPNDIYTKFQWLRTTAVGTAGASWTPVARDSQDRAAVSTVGVGTYTGEPTYTANSILWGQALNQRASYHWVCSPYCEIIAPATANNGIAIRSIASGGSPPYDVNVIFRE